MRSPNRADERGGIRRTDAGTNMRSMSIAGNMSNGEIPTNRLTFFCRRSAILKKTIAIPVLIFVLTIVVTGCRSDPTQPAATSGADVETPVATPPRDISGAGQTSSTRTNPDPSEEVRLGSGAGLAQPRGPSPPLHPPHPSHRQRRRRPLRQRRLERPNLCRPPPPPWCGYPVPPWNVKRPLT